MSSHDRPEVERTDCLASSRASGGESALSCGDVATAHTCDLSLDFGGIRAADCVQIGWVWFSAGGMLVTVLLIRVRTKYLIAARRQAGGVAAMT